MKSLAPIASALAAVVLATLLLVPSCTDRGDSDSEAPRKRVTQVQEPEDALDEEVMLALLQAKNFHHKANVYEMNGELDKAITEIRKILAIKFPPETAEAPEVHDTQLDARARLGKLLMKQDKHDEAMKVVDAGLATAKRDSFFVANLYTVKGQLHEARASKLKDSTTAADKQAFREHSRKAIENLDRSIKMNEALQKKLMKGQAP